MPTAGMQYPVREDGLKDRRFDQLARNVGLVLEQHGYPRVKGEARDELEALLYRFVYGVQDGGAS